MPMKPDVNAVLSGQWQVEMMKTPTEKPATCCYGFWCPCCFAYQQREKLLEMTQEPYVCCAGLSPCGPCGEPGENKNPWLCLETCCCTNTAIIANRFMLQTRFNIQNDSCDETLLGIIACLNCLSIIISIFGDRRTADSCEQLTECVNASVCACMLTQQDIQIKAIEETFKTQPYGGMPPHVLMALPPEQQQMMHGFTQIQPTAPLCRPMAAPPQQYGAMAAPQQQGVLTAPRQMMVTVPPGTMPGQPVQFTTPEGVLVQVLVPAGVSPGQQFGAAY